MTTAWQETLDAGDILLIDGGMGTELQRRGVPMNEVVWSGAAVATNPDAVRETHEDYIRAGASESHHYQYLRLDATNAGAGWLW
jgi:homocysteine S-methyltransferase